jgi:hypothetical protein
MISATIGEKSTGDERANSKRIKILRIGAITGVTSVDIISPNLLPAAPGIHDIILSTTISMAIIHNR